MNITVAGRTVVAHHGETQVGMLMLADDGEVQWVGVHKAHRRTGVATALWDAARAAGLDPRHSGCREPEGTLWARSVGGDLPRLHTLPCARCAA